MNDRQEGEVWTVGADATLQSLFDEPACPALLRRALADIPSWQVRRETSVSRTIKASSLQPQWLAALLAMGAFVTLKGEENPPSQPEGAESVVPLEDVLDRRVSGEVAALHIPTPGSPTVRWGDAHVARTASDEPIVAAFATVEMNDHAVEQARLALTGVWPEPVRLAGASGMLVGKPLSEDWIEAVASAVEEAVEPQGDYRGSAAYRRAMAATMTRRALEACAAAPAAGGGR